MKTALDSPFLDETGIGEAEDTAVAPLQARIASPYLDALEPDREAGSDPAVELQAADGTLGASERQEVGDTTVPPYRWVCSIAYEAADGTTLQGGSGVLVSDRHVLTAGHVIRDKVSKPAAHSVYVYPGRHYGGAPFGRIPVARARVSRTNFDFGLITLDRPVDPRLQWWGAPSTRSVWWSEALVPLQGLVGTATPLSTAGYPRAMDRQRRRMFQSDGFSVRHAFAGDFRHTLATTEGQSGSPIWTVHNGVFVLLGIAASYNAAGQSGVFVDMARREVEQWIAEDAPKVQRRIALEVPYRWVCRLEVYDNDLRRAVGYGTGLLISDRHVVTSASVIHDFSKDRRRYSIRVTPGHEFGKEALGSTTASGARVPATYSPQTQDASADYGLLTLSRPLGGATFSAIKNAALGFWGGESHGLATSAADWSGKSARIAAFSRSSGGGGGYHALRAASGAIVGLQRGQILHKAGSTLDAPGAPIWVEAPGRRLLVGIASSIFSKHTGVNWGCYLGPEARHQLMQWVNEGFERKELEAGEHFTQDELESVAAFPRTEPKGPSREAEDPWVVDESLPQRDEAIETDEASATSAEPVEAVDEWLESPDAQEDAEFEAEAFDAEAVEAQDAELESDLDLEHLGVLEHQLGAASTSPTLGFEFDLNYGFEREVVDAKGLAPPAGFDWPSEGLKATDHEGKDGSGNFKDAFVVTMDAVRMEIATVPFHIDNDAEFNAIVANVTKFGQQLIDAKKTHERSLDVPGFSGHPTTFEHPRTVVNKPEVDAHGSIRFPGDREHASYRLAPVPLVVHRVSSAYPTATGLWAAPQATVTLPLAEFGKLVWEIHLTRGGAPGEAFTGRDTDRLGLRDDLAWLALTRAMADRKKKLGTVLSDGTKVTDADYTRTLTSLVAILLMYLLTSIKKDDRDQRRETFAKGSLPLNVKTPLWQIHKFALTDRERFVLHELYTDSGKRKVLFALASGKTGGEGATKLFPDYTQLDAPRFLGTAPTWHMLVDALVKEQPVIVTVENRLAKKGHLKGDEILIAPLSSKIDWAKTKPRIAVEMRRLGFHAVGFAKWPGLMTRIRALARKVNP